MNIPIFILILTFLITITPVTADRKTEVNEEDGLSVIGAGMGRTGTDGLRQALAILGHGPAFHMFENARQPWLFLHWRRLDDDVSVRESELEYIMRGYRSAVDFPASLYYKELKKIYPKAKVILSVRDTPEAWWDSASSTIARFCDVRFEEMTGAWLMFHVNPYGWLFRRGTEHNYCAKVFPQGARSREHALAYYKSTIEEAKRVIPKKDLLIYNSKEGWKPLCDFLGVPIPSVPYPHTNDKGGFQAGPIFAFIVGGYLTVAIYILIFYFAVVRRFLGKGRRGNSAAAATGSGKKSKSL